MLICFTGIEGSGKTTHISTLIQWIKERGYSSSYMWAGTRPFLSNFFYFFAYLLGYSGAIRRKEFVDPLKYAPQKVTQRLSPFFRAMLFIDFQLRVVSSVRVRLLRYNVVVCDRYFFDLIMELRICNKSSRFFENLLVQTTPKPDITYLMDVPEEEASERRNLSIVVFKDRRRAYLKMANEYDFKILDTNKPFKDNAHRILDYLSEVFPA